MNRRRNLILATDSYKPSHYLQIPEGTTLVNNYIESRGSDDPDFTATVFAGIQAVIKEYFLDPITLEDINEAQELIEAHGEPFNRAGWMRILEKWNGYIPIQIEAVPEGMVIPLNNVLCQVRNLDLSGELSWLGPYFETIILRAVWYMTTVATNSWTIKQEIKKYYDLTGSVEGIDFKLHDFGARGVSSGESAALGGIGHLINFMGTDTLEAIVGARDYYNEPMAGYSIPAAEHFTITIWGKDNDGEVAAYRNMLKQFAKPGKLVAIVSDSYNLWEAIDLWGTELKDDVINSKATVVIRPDSGDPETVPIKAIQELMNYYGYTTNDKGFRTLPSCIRVIQGDGVTKDSIKTILKNLYDAKLTVDNLAFGMGGGMLQLVNRDTLKFAMKVSYAVVDGVGRNVSKEPIGDKSKRSKEGILKLLRLPMKDNNTGLPVYLSVSENKVEDGTPNVLRPVYETGKLLVDDDLATIRRRSNQY